MEPLDDSVQLLATTPSCFVVAPAGCGKTELIVNTVSISGEKSLILTHTHAGVQSLRKRFKKKNVRSSMFFVSTLDGWSYKWVMSYPILSGLDPTKSKLLNADDWVHIRTCMLQLAQTEIFHEVFQKSFSALFVDEYQDCTTQQHDLVVLLSRIIPTKVLGDPLQGLFSFAGAINWEEKVPPSFNELNVQYSPWRWAEVNPTLGSWITRIRPEIKMGLLSLTSLPIGVTWNQTNPQTLLSTCKTAMGFDGSVLVICKWPRESHDLSRRLGALYKSMETIESSDLNDFLSGITISNHKECLLRVLNFVVLCFTTAEGNIVKLYIEKLAKNLNLDRVRSNLWLKDCIDNFSGDVTSVLSLMKEVEKNLDRKRIHRIELWSEAIKSLEFNILKPELSPLEAGLHVRNKTRITGRPEYRRIISRTLLVKGLEFDHVIIADADGLGDKENLYVALTRARKSITIFSRTRQVSYRSPFG